MSARVPALADAAVDDRSGLVVALSREDGGRLHLFSPAGAATGTIDAPSGYALSHLVAAPAGLMVVGQGESAVDGWHDWHFAIDAAAASLSRASPAY